MTGPDHYEAAEQLLNKSKDQHGNYVTSPNLTAALVHAVLGLAAATALNDHDPNGEGMPGEDTGAWKYAASVEVANQRAADEYAATLTA